MKYVVKAAVGNDPKIRGRCEDLGWVANGTVAGLGNRLDSDDFHSFWF
jgi:hypothetical protein